MPTKPLVIVTRKLPDVIETRMMELFDVRLNLDDRPLSQAQIAYAISDVTHLRDVYLTLSADLERRHRTEWVNEEMEILISPETYRLDPESAWERLRTRVRKPKELAVLIEVAAWREREARARDVPRGRVRGTRTVSCDRAPARLRS